MVVRPATPADMPLVLETTAKVRWPQGLSFKDWVTGYTPAIYRAMEGGQTLVVDADGVLLGFVIVTQDQEIFSLYVKKSFRGNGLGLSLLSAAGLQEPFHAHRPTPSFNQWLRHHGLRQAA